MDEPWEMTKEEYLNKEDGFPELPCRVKLLVRGGFASFDEVVGNWHKHFVETAISEGQSVPVDVILDYPEFYFK